MGIEYDFEELKLIRRTILTICELNSDWIISEWTTTGICPLWIEFELLIAKYMWT